MKSTDAKTWKEFIFTQNGGQKLKLKPPGVLTHTCKSNTQQDEAETLAGVGDTLGVHTVNKG